MRKLKLKIGLIMAAALVLSACAMSMRLGPVDRDNPNGEAWIEQAQSQIRASMKDPESAQFRRVVVSSNQKTGEPIVCGEVNGKNSYGGYTGFYPFAYLPKRGGHCVHQNKDSYCVFKYPVRPCTQLIRSLPAD